MWEIFIEKRLYPTYILEFLTVLAGVYYLMKAGSVSKADKFLVYTLIFLFAADFFGILYAMYGYVYEFRFFEFIRGTRFDQHWWIANIASLIITTAFTLYFSYQIVSRRRRRMLMLLIVLYLVSSIISYFLTDTFFTTIAPIPYVMSAFLICFSIIVYYLELLKTNRILNFKSELAIYVSFGLLIYKLALTPLFIFQRYIRVSDEFEEVYGVILDLANIFLYSIIIIGFLKQIRVKSPFRKIAQ